MKLITFILLLLMPLVNTSAIDNSPNFEIVTSNHCEEDDKLLNDQRLEVLMSKTELEFLISLIKKYKPKKILEIGVFKGGSSAVILNSIKDMRETKLYSIDLSETCYSDSSKPTGYVVNEHFLHLAKDKWKLYLGNMAAKFIDEIGGDIDFVFIDTMHTNPGEILDFLQILPFLKEEAVVVFHDVSCHIFAGEKLWTNCALLSTIKGRKIIPNIIPYSDLWFDIPLAFPNIGAIKLEAKQQRFAFDYFNLLVLPWYYMPNDEQISLLKAFFKKHYNDFCCSIFERAVSEHTRLHTKLQKKSVLRRIIDAIRN
ncbi:MAG: class I SAM-dependent methyltransferase [Holosporaceae bacterium]|nr:class I SAM-dependent methyltransferase [Holosporaceae bacterium]